MPGRGTAPRSLADSQAELRLGQRWLLVVGLVILVLGVGYFLKYSFEQNWIGPAARVSLAYLVGLLGMALGEYFRRRKFDLFGQYLVGGGLAVLYFAAYAAFELYHLIGQPGAFTLMALVTILAGGTALRYDSMGLAVLGLVGGFATPLVLRAQTDNQIGLMVYMTLLNAGVLGLAAFKQWIVLNSLSFVFTWLLFGAWYAEHYSAGKFWPTTLFLNLFFVTYAVVPYLHVLVRATKDRVRGYAITFPNAFIAFGFSYAMIEARFAQEWVAVVSIAYALLFLVMAGLLFARRPNAAQPIVLLVAKCSLFLVITVPLLASRHWISCFWAAQGLALAWAAMRLSDRRLRTAAIAVLALAAVKLVGWDLVMVFEWRGDGFYYEPGFAAQAVERWTTMIVLLGCLYLAAGMVARAAGGTPREASSAGTALRLAFALLLFGFLNLETAAYFHDHVPQARFASISVLWALFSIALMALGFLRKSLVLRVCSLGLFALTVIKVFLRDMVHVSTPYRILSFVGLGLMLIGASYLYHRYKTRLIPPAASSEGG
ncbi:MAG: DUF2339 domain-containing protein [Planctomycetes bacterium]|nr:DUF2339 domain-containing protein [Planctomycetota bacterium]